jgi:hypothetical protein
MFDQCNADITAGPLAHREVDLSNIDAPYIGWPLERVCKETQFTPGLVFLCDNNSGGIGNIRNYILTCLRYAIEAGATGLVVPQISTRSEKNLADLMLDHREFDYFFNKQHFRTALNRYCPSIQVFDNTWDIPHFREPFQAERITPREFGPRGGCDSRDLNRHTDLFRSRFEGWLNETALRFGRLPRSWKDPRVIRLNWGVQWDWPVYRDGPEFVATYGGLLRFREDILELGSRTVEAMQQLTRTRNKVGRYAGFHLRTENDALRQWPNFERQATEYLTDASAHALQTAYLATGNGTEAAKFKDRALSQHHMLVVTKYDLLQDRPEGLKALQSLTWDQQALVDFIVLLESDFFLGVNPSSFSINVALKRHLQADGLFTRSWNVGRDDGRSRIVGNFSRYWDDWLFMYDSIWP